MATCRDVVTRAMRAAGILRLTAQPTAAEAEYGLEALRSLYATWLASGMFGRLTDHYSDGDYTAEEGQRITVGSGTVTIPDLVEDDTRAPREFSAIVVVDGDAATQYVYSDGSWQRLDALALESTAPLSSLGSHGLACCLAIELSSPFTGDTPPTVIRAAGRFKTALSLKLGNEREPHEAVWF